MNPVNVYQPQVSATLHKLNARKTLNGKDAVSNRFANVGQTIDLTQFLGDGAGFRTTKGVREPAGGFSITLVDRPISSGGALDSLAGVIEPMDAIEIRFRHGPAPAGSNPTQIPVLLRGFVSRLKRSETMGSDGKPQRTITLTGLDYGGVLQRLQVKFLPGYQSGSNLLTGFKLFELFGVGYQTTLKVNDFAQQMFDKVVNPYLAAMLAGLSQRESTQPSKYSPLPTAIKVEAGVRGTSAIAQVQTAEGSIYSILRSWTDAGLFNEMYTDDREDGVYFVLRPNPFLGLDGKPVQSDAPTLKPIVLSDVDVLSLDLERSDDGVSNFYWVRAPAMDLISDQFPRMQWGMASSADQETINLSGYLNSAEATYGLRVLEVDSQTSAEDITSMSSGKSKEDNDKRDQTMHDWINERRDILVRTNQDNVLFSFGTMRVRAREDLKAGNYVQLARGGFSALYYVVKVDTDYVFGQGVFQTLHVERGTDFIERIRQGGVSSPYLAEMTNANGA